MVSIVGTESETVRAASSSGSQINGLHTTTSDTDLLLCFAAIEGNEAPEASSPCTFDGNDLTLIRDTGSTGSNSDVRVLVYGLISPGAVTNGDTVFDWQFAGAPACAVFVNVEGVDTTSVAAATNYISEDINTTASATSVLSSGGTSGRSLIAFAVGQGSDMNPSSADNSFVELVEGQTAATTDDFSYNVSYLLGGAPSGVTITWTATDQNTGVLIELVPGSMDATPTLTGVSGTGQVGVLSTNIPSIGVSLVGVSGTGEVGTLSASTGQPGSAEDFGIQIEGTTDVLLQENNDKILLEGAQLPDVIVVSGFLREINKSSVVSSSAKITITRTVRLVSDTGNLIPMSSGNNLDIVYNIRDENGDIVDLTGGSITWLVKTSGTDTAIITKTSPSGGVALTTPTSGVATVTLDPSDTSSLTGTYTLDGQFTDSGSNVYTFEDGGLRIR